MLFLTSVCIAALLVNLLLQLGGIAAGIKVAFRGLDPEQAGVIEGVRRLGVFVTFLFFGHLLQIGVWAGLFRMVGALPDFRTAFYHSTVNYSSLGYGDLVMDEPWRLAGALEASVGVMMFGVSTATLFAAVSRLFRTRFGKREDS